MVEKNYEKKSKKSCQKDCKGRIIGYDQYCSHIENLLPPKSSRLLSTGFNVENYQKPIQINVEKEVNYLVKKLKRYGIESYRIKLILARAVDGMTLAEIVKEQNWTSLGAANHHLQKTIKELRKRGFK